VLHPWLEPNRPFKTVIAVGRLVQEKNFPLLINTIGKARDSLDVRCLILGDGILRSELEDMVAGDEAIIFLGRVPSPELYLAQADLFVLTSNAEGSPTVMVEALQCGLKIVATDCGGPAEILDNGKYGRLVPPNDLDALARAIIDELATPRDPEMLKARAADFHVSKAADHYLEMIFGAPGTTGRLDER